MTLNFNVLPHQKSFIKSTVNTMLCGGYGSGKSDAGTLKTIFKKLQYPKYKVAYYLPSYGLVRDIAYDKFPTTLEQLGLNYKLNKSDKEILIDGYSKIIFRSMDNPETIVGYETAYSLIDEADILPLEKMEKVYQKILGRNRSIIGGTVDAVSTPEGFKWLYQMANSGHFEVIKAKTTDNKFLPPDYIQSLKDQYPEALLKAYLNGEFVNLSQGTVYSSFNREQHHSDREVEQYDKLLIGQDFNVGGCVSVVYVETGMGLIAVDEYESVDTQRIIDNTKEKYPYHDVTFSPDSSGYANKTNASRSDIQMILDAGFEVDAPSQNGRVMDRVNATNNAFEKGWLYINTNKCPKFTKALEQQAWTEKGEPEKFNGAGTIDDYTDAGTYPVVRKLGLTRPKVNEYVDSFL